MKDPEKEREEDRRRDTEADRGVKTYRGTREDGSAWEKVNSWFGYKVHILVDSVHELPLVFRVTKASAGDSPELLTLVNDLEENHADLAERANELAADKAYDSRENKRVLFDDFGIRPYIDHRRCWPEGMKTRSLKEGQADFFVYDEVGGVHCICPATGQMRAMRPAGYEADRKTLKYRCPAAAGGFTCRRRPSCESRASVGGFGRTVRVSLETDRRIFTPTPRPSSRWRKAYDLRTAVERVNGRLDSVLGFERHTIRGKKKMETRLTLAFIVMLAMALGRILEGQSDRLRSFLAPVKRKAG